MNNCQNCRHWMREIDTIFVYENGWRPCENELFTQMIAKSFDEPGWIYTSPDFACTYHAPVTP
jgi:hypothetical protein